MSKSTSLSATTITSLTVLGGLLAYAAYFDYRRRNDTVFRKKLRVEKKKAEKAAAEDKAREAEEAAKQGPLFKLSPDEVLELYAKAREDAIPENVDGRKAYFDQNLSRAELLSSQGPVAYLEAAVCYFKALLSYPSASHLELLKMYEESIKNPDIMMVILELYRVDALARIDGYYDHFPPKEKNVSIEEIETKNEGRGPAKVHVLVASKDFKAGEEIYKESPIISALDPSVQSAKTHCSQCMRKVQTDMTISPESDLLDSVYCSKKCQLDAKAQSQNFLFGLEPPVPLDIIPLPITADTQSARKEAQTSFVDYLKRTSKVGPLLVARLVATQIGYELAKAVNPQLASSFTGHPGSNSNSPYSINDHLERLRYLQMTVPDAESTLSRNLFKKTLLDFGEEHSTLRHIVIRGKIAYNAIGVCFPGDETTKATERPEDVERTRTPYGTSKQVGCGLYFVSSYLGHSCEPSVRPSFSHGTSELRLIANRRIEKGEQLTMSYVDVSQRPGESISAARTRRRYEIARGWRFACECPKCVREAGKKDESLSDLTASGSRVEHVTRHADQTSRAS